MQVHDLPRKPSVELSEMPESIAEVCVAKIPVTRFALTSLHLIPVPVPVCAFCQQILVVLAPNRDVRKSFRRCSYEEDNSVRVLIPKISLRLVPRIRAV